MWIRFHHQVCVQKLHLGGKKALYFQLLISRIENQFGMKCGRIDSFAV